MSQILHGVCCVGSVILFAEAGTFAHGWVTGSL